MSSHAKTASPDRLVPAYRPCAAGCGVWISPAEPSTKRFCTHRCRVRGKRKVERQSQSAPRVTVTPEPMSSGPATERCEECSQDDLDGAGCACQQPRTIQHQAALACLQCGREVDSVIVPRADSRVLIPRSLRCEVCGGRPIVSEVSTVSIYPTLPRMQARLGRPPKWLIEQRRLERSA